MKILALDSSGLVASVAVMEDDTMLAEYTMNYKKTHSQTLLPMLDEMAKMIELDLNTVDAIAVAGGPGSFTGLRIGSATAKGLGLALNIPIISSMGTGNRLNCTGFVIDKVEKTAGNGCGLSKVMRQELKKRGITGHTSLFNTRPPESKAVNSANGRNAPGSCPFAPNVAGLMVAQYVVSQLL